MRLRDVLEHPAGRLPVLVGEDALDRPLQTAFTTDLLDPGRYLSGGELVLTGLVWRRGPADSEVFVERLAEAGASALGAGEGLLGGVPDDLVRACERHSLPLFAVPADTSFREITDRITAVLWAEREARALAARSRGLTAALSSGGDLASVWPSRTAWLIGSTGRVLAGPPLPEAPRLATAFLTADGLPGPVRIGGRTFHLELLPGVPRLGGRFVAATSAREAEELVPLASVDLVGQESARRIERRLAGQLADVLADGEPPLPAMRACGLDPADRHVVLVASLPSGPVVELVEELVGGAVAERDGCAVAVTPDRPGLLEDLRDRAHRLASVTRLTAGLSLPADPSGLATAFAEARHTHAYALDRLGRSRVIRSDELASHDLLLAGVPAVTRHAFADRILAPLAAYDARHHSELLRTLEAFLACDGSWTRCAAVMHVHVNTLRYRIKRISELTGRDLDRFEDRVDFHLALRLRG